jgi:hypothetical protein
MIRATLARPAGMNVVYYETDILPYFNGDDAAASAFIQEYGLDDE